MVLFVVALLIWFALSVPATLLIGRIFAASSRATPSPFPERRMAMSGRSLLRR
jgi:hypothetical protein